MKLRMFFAVLWTLVLITAAFLFPYFWIAYKEWLHADEDVLILPAIATMLMFAFSLVGVGYSWARSFDSKMK